MIYGISCYFSFGCLFHFYTILLLVLINFQDGHCLNLNQHISKGTRRENQFQRSLYPNLSRTVSQEAFIVHMLWLVVSRYLHLELQAPRTSEFGEAAAMAGSRRPEPRCWTSEGRRGRGDLPKLRHREPVAPDVGSGQQLAPVPARTGAPPSGWRCKRREAQGTAAGVADLQ